MNRWFPLFLLTSALAAQTDPGIDSLAAARQGLAFRDQGQWAEAASAIRQAAEANPSLKPFLLLQLVNVLEKQGDPLAAAAVAETIARDFATSSAAPAAILRRPALFALGADREKAVAALQAADSVKVDELTELPLLKMADALAAAGWIDLASSVRMRVLRDYPQGKQTEATFDHLNAAESSPLRELDFDESLKLADRLSRVNRFPEALELLESTSKRFPARSTAPLLQYTRLRSLFQSRNYDEVIRTPRLKPRDAFYLESEMLRGRAFWRTDRNEQFLTVINRVLTTAPNSPQAAEARLQLSKYYTIDEKDFPRAARYLEEAIRTLGNGGEGENLWNLGWIYIVAGNDEQALKTLERYIAAFPDADYTTNALFWSGKIHDRRGNPVERDVKLRRLIEFYPYAYYSYRARQILGEAPEAPLTVTSGFKFPEIPEQGDSRLGTVKDLQSLGLNDEATAELKLVAGDAPTDPVLAYRLAELYVSAGQPLRAISLLQRNFRNIIRHGGSNVPARFWEILYPRLYWSDITAAAAKVTLDPYLISSIIRQESGFEPTVVSSAGAVGLMQIMPHEAPTIASHAGLESEITRQQLFEPSLNVALGATEYLQKLQAMNGNQVLAIASYNAGESAVGRWLARTPVEDVDLFVDSIPFNETRLYVKNVIRNHYEYRRIYGNGSSS